MIPYIAVSRIPIGPFELPVFRSLFLAAGLVGAAIVLVRLSRAGFGPRQGLPFVGIVAWCALLGSRAFDLVVRNAENLPQLLGSDPFAVLYFWQSFYSVGAAAGMLVGLLLGAWALGLRRSQVMDFLDAVGFALPFAWATARLGCSLVHDHVGPASDHWLAVRFPAGPRLDFGVLEFLGMLVIAVAFAALPRSRGAWPRGFHLALFFALYGPLRFSLDLFRENEIGRGGLTATQLAVAAASTIALLALSWMFVRRDRKGDLAVGVT